MWRESESDYVVSASYHPSLLLPVPLFSKHVFYTNHKCVRRVVCRAFQGMGASGIYSMVNVIIPTIVPVKHVPLYISIIALVYTLSSIIGPLVGGVITVQGGDAWRWVFWLK